MSVGWIHLAPDEDHWRAVVNTVLIFRSSLTHEEFLDYQTNYLIL